MVGTDSTCRPASRLFVRLYDDLHGIAVDYLRRELREHTLQPAAVVHEAFLRLTRHESLSGAERTRFLAVAAQTMRQVLVDYARRRGAYKRGGRSKRITLSDGVLIDDRQPVDLLGLDHALRKLAEHHERAARVVELRFFGGLEERDIARELGLSRTTVQAEWRFARAWLHRELGS